MVKRVRFIVTGDLERLAIVASVSRLFAREGVEWLRPRKIHGATSNRLRRGQPPSGGMKAMAKALVAEALEGEDRSGPADLVIAIDDVELHNFDQREVICEQIREAIEGEIHDRSGSMQNERRIRERVRRHCSFHLMCPMAEAYVFGDVGALQRAGCSPSVRAHLTNSDLEDFECADSNWLPHCDDVDRRMALSCPWWRERRHSKNYLAHLVDRSGGFYDEVLGGRDAFAGLNWAAVADGARIELMRALFEDLADFLERENPLGTGASSPLTYPGRSVRRDQLLLRNC